MTFQELEAVLDRIADNCDRALPQARAQFAGAADDHERAQLARRVLSMDVQQAALVLMGSSALLRAITDDMRRLPDDAEVELAQRALRVLDRAMTALGQDAAGALAGFPDVRGALHAAGEVRDAIGLACAGALVYTLDEMLEVVREPQAAEVLSWLERRTGAQKS